MTRPTLSIVVPIFNEEAVIPELRRQLAELMDRLEVPCEVILVDDGSRDQSRDLLHAAAAEDDRFKILLLSRNFGHQMAVSAGLDHAGGDAVIIMDADLQDPPEVVPEMVARWREGYDVVYGVRADRSSDTRFKRATAKAFYRILARSSRVDIPVEAGDFRLVDRRVVDVVNQMPERNRFLRGLFSWVGFKQIGVEYTRQPRYAGKTKYTLGKMVNFAADGIVNFSVAPLRLALNLGFVFVALSLSGVVIALGAKIFGFFTVPGWASLSVAVLLLGGMQLLTMGMIGEYVGRIYQEVKGRPLYLVSERVGFEPVDDDQRGPASPAREPSVLPP